MYRSLLAAGLMALAVEIHAETFTIDTNHTDVGFTVRHLMLSNVSGRFNAFNGSVDYDTAEDKLLSMGGTINTSSIDTGNDKRDGRLKSRDFFNVEAYPNMTFKSSAVEKTGDHSFKVNGTLTVLGVDHEVILLVNAAGPIDNPWGKKRIGLSCKTTLNRRDLGITKAPVMVIGEEIDVHIDAEAVYQ